MKPILQFLTILVGATLAALLAQGPLAPPGAPAPTMKSLDQIEARTPISSLPLTINASGSYYLTKDLGVSSGDAISINASGVTLDLHGFTISSTEASPTGTAILLGSALSDITICNGHIRGGVTQSGGAYSGSGFAYGIYSTSNPRNVRVLGVTVSGCLLDGITVAINSTIVESCAISTVGGFGIYAASVNNSTALECGGTAIFGNQVFNCHGESIYGDGVYASTATNCQGKSNSGDGLYAETGSNCFGQSNSGKGLYVVTASNCNGYSGSDIGVYAYYLANNCYGYSSSGSGLLALRTAIGCYGESSSASFAALQVSGTASFCSGRNFGGGPAIQTCIAIGCTTFQGAVNASCSKWLGTP